MKPASMLQQPPESPPVFNTTTPAMVLLDARRLMEGPRQVHDRIAATVTPATAAFENVIAPLAHAENTRILGVRLLAFYSSVSTNPELREASRGIATF
jgi:metallopeptidase MepB